MLLGVKFAVGAAGLLVVLAAYWAGVYLGMPGWGNPNFLWGFFGPGHHAYIEAIPDRCRVRPHGPAVVFSLPDPVHCRVPRLSFFRPFRSSSDNRPDDRLGWTVLLGNRHPYCFPFEPVSYYLMLIFHTVLERDAKILRQAFEPSLLLARVAGAVLLAGGVLLWACRAFREQASRRFQWIVGALSLISGGIVMWLDVTQSQGVEEPTEPVGRLPYEVPVVDLALKDRGGGGVAGARGERGGCGRLAGTEGKRSGGNRRLAVLAAGPVWLDCLCLGIN